MTGSGAEERDAVRGLARRLAGDVAPAAAWAAAGLTDLPPLLAVHCGLEAGRVSVGYACSVLTDVQGGPVLAAAFAGAGRALVVLGVGYARERAVFGRPLAANAVQRDLFARASADVEAAAALAVRAAGTGDPVELAACVPAAADAAWRAAETALQVHGGHGYAAQSEVAARWLDVVQARARLPLADLSSAGLTPVR